MGYFWEEDKEEDESFDFSNTDFGAADDDVSFDFSDSAFGTQEMTPVESSIERMQKSYGSFAADYLPDILGGDYVPDELKGWGEVTQAESQERLNAYRSKYLPDITDEEWQNVLPSVWEKVQENAAVTGTQLAGATVGGRLFSIPTVPTKVAGGVILAGTALSSIPPIMDEVISEHAQIAGISVDDMTREQRFNAYWTASENWLFENLTPARWAKISSKGTPMPKNAREMETHLNTVEKEGILTQMNKAGKEALKSGATSGTEEVIQKANVARTSAKGMDAFDAGEYITEGVVGAAVGTGAGVVPGTSVARSHNKVISQGTKYLEQLNQQNLLQAGADYQAAMNVGPNLPGFDVIPESYEVPTLEKSTLQNLGGLAYEKLLGRSTNIFEDMLSRAKTGKEASTIHNDIFSMFGDVETGSGLAQEGSSFNTTKHSKLGEYATDFAKIQQKWAKMFFPGFGEMGSKINPLIDQYIRARLEGKSTSEIGINSILNSKQVKELDADAVQLRKIYNKVHKDLSSILGESDLKFGFTKNYLTRGIDIKAIEKDKEGFINDLVNNVGVLPKGKSEETATMEDRYAEAERIYNDILNGKDPAVMSSEQIRRSKTRKGETRKGFEKHRDLRWDALDDKYRKSGAFESMQDYLTRAATRAASAQVFGGNRAEKLASAVDKSIKSGVMTTDEAQTVWDMYDAEHNIYKRPKNERERAGQKASRGLSSVTAVSLLGLATISSITEPAWISGRVGLANMLKATPTVATHVLKGIVRTLYSRQGKEANASFGRDLLNVMGMAINPQVNERVEMLMTGDVTPSMTAWFRSPGGLFLTQYTNFVRVWTAVAGLKMIQSQANKVNSLKGTKLAALTRELKENGMSIEDFKQMIRLGKGTIDIMNDEFLNSRFTKSNGTQVSVRDLLVPWVRKITTDVALEPHVGNRPLWMSNPNLQLISQLKSFPVLFGNTVMKRTMRQLNPKTCTPQIVGAVGAIGSAATAIALASLAIALKDAIRGNEEEMKWYEPIGAMGIPYAGTQSLQQLVTPAGATVVDSWIRTPFQDEGSTAENILDLLTRATIGTIFAEQLDE
jgi:hypothetical protein